MVEDFTAVLVWLLLLLFSTFGFCLWILVADAVIPVAVTAKTPRVIFCTTVAMWFCMCLLLWIRFLNDSRTALLWGSMSVWSCFLRIGSYLVFTGLHNFCVHFLATSRLSTFNKMQVWSCDWQNLGFLCMANSPDCSAWDDVIVCCLHWNGAIALYWRSTKVLLGVAVAIEVSSWGSTLCQSVWLSFWIMFL